MKIKSIHIKLPKKEDVLIHSELDENTNEMIGKTVNDYNKFIYYYAKITEEKNGAFSIKDLYVVKPEAFNVGNMKLNQNGGLKNYITVITNRKMEDNLLIYPNAILSVVLTEEN